MGIEVDCTVCLQPLRQQGALVFAPPVGTYTMKFHVCIRCWRRLQVWLGDHTLGAEER